MNYVVRLWKERREGEGEERKGEGARGRGRRKRKMRKIGRKRKELQFLCFGDCKA